MIQLRPYQKTCIDHLYWWLERNAGHPCIVLPTGAGKSLVIAHLCKDLVTQYHGVKILMLTARKELIEQNADKLRSYWPNAPLGIYSASVGRKEVEQITFAGIQSVRNKVDLFADYSIVIVDEAHEISHNETGSYRQFLFDLEGLNPALRVVGLTASPYRLGHGMITDKPAIFDDLIETVTIAELQAKGYLAKLISKDTKKHYDLKDVHKLGGDYKEAELQAAVDKELDNQEAVAEIIARAGERKAWLIFCAGVQHSYHIRDILLSAGIEAETVTGDTPKSEREAILADFKAGKIRAITNANILTTGFDYPGIDLIAMLRPTCSVGLYYQMAGRGLRVATGKDNCLVLDFAGNVSTHGPVTALRTPDKKKNGDGVAPAKLCPECDEILPVQTRTCPECGYQFPTKEEERKWRLSQDDISGEDRIKTMEISTWEWTVQESKKSKKNMIVVKYYPADILQEPVNEYLCVWHDGYAGVKAMATLRDICKQAGVPEIPDEIETMSRTTAAPARIKYEMDGKFPRIVHREWEELPF